MNLEKEKLKIIYEVIKDEIDDAEFEKSIKFLTRRQKELYPSTNIAVLILDADNRLEQRKFSSQYPVMTPEEANKRREEIEIENKRKREQLKQIAKN